HGGESASDARQGHDTAVHLVWGIVDDLAGLGHGNAARADARASADREPVAAKIAGAGRGRGLMRSTVGPGGLVAPGGTGGHLFPAEALAAALQRGGITVDLATDARGGRYGSKFPARQVHIIPSETVRGRNPIARARTGVMLGLGFAKAMRVLGRIQPAARGGFRGHPTLPPLLAA